MRSLRKFAASALALALVAVPVAALVLLAGCRKEEEIFVDRNLAPNTRLTSAPGPYAQANYRVHMYWDGTDPDGFVAGYYFAWDDTTASAWVYTQKTDSLFKALIDTAGETRRHTFYVRSVDNEGKLDPSPARVRFDAWTVLPRITSLYREDGPEDSLSANYNPGYKDTVLMGSACAFLWTGEDPDGEGAPIDFSWRLDSNASTEWDPTQSAVVTDIASGTHYFYVQAKDETGAECFPSNYKFVMNYSPDSEVLEPIEPSGTLTIPNNTEIVFRWDARDKEEDEGLEGGVREVWIELDTGFQQRFEYTGPPYTGEWYFTSTAPASDPHYIGSVNFPTGGNKPHEFRVYARDIEDRFETPSNVPEDREKYIFWYNYPPTTVILSPAPGQTVGPSFTVSWQGSDVDGTIEAYQFVLDPRVNSWQQTENTSVSYTDVEPGEHTFKVRARDSSDCWEVGYREVVFYVQ